MSISTALSLYHDFLDDGDAKEDPEAASVAILLIHHLVDYNEALEKGDESYAKASIQDIAEIVKDLHREDWERIENLFSRHLDYSRFRDDIDLFLREVI